MSDWEGCSVLIADGGIVLVVEGAPSGTLTFMFTDVERSTALWEAAPEEMASALARHDEIVRGVVAGQGGFVFATVGDGFGVAFGSVSAAARAAVMVQERIVAACWPAGSEIRVRVGLHTGSAVERDGDYFGTAVNRAARITALGHGGQVVVSAVTAALLAEHGWPLVDAGVRRLDGLQRPERLHRLVVPGVGDVDLPLRGGGGAGNLPLRRGGLIGRAVEVEAVAALLAPGAVCSVVGVGGVGKTRVALAAARSAEGRFGDGAWWVELASVVAPEDVAPAVATALGIQVLREVPALEAVVAALAAQARLVLLDNCEHLLDPVVELVERLGERCPHVAVLTTTRETLGVADEEVVLLRPLPTGRAGDEAVSAAALLFCERTRAALGGFEPTGGELEVVERLCRRLDGLPLAIELAAARMPTMTLDELERHLERRFSVLSRRRGAVERHQSLRMTVAWSYDQLGDDERLVFDCLSVFTGPFDLDAARAVLGDDANDIVVDDVVHSLAAKSLLTVVRTNSGTRFQQLETLRQYGEERSEERGMAAAVHCRHLDHFVAWSGRAYDGILGPDEFHWHHEIQSQWHNVRGALRWACDVGDGEAAMELLGNLLWWAAIRMTLEAADWISDVLSLPTASDHPKRPMVLAFASVLALVRGDNDRAIRLVDLAAAEEARLGVLEPWIPVADVAAHPEYNYDQRIAGALEAQRRGARLPYVLHVGLMYEVGARTENVDAGHLDERETLSQLERIHELAASIEAFGNPGLIALSLSGRALALRRRDPSSAITHLERALEIAVAGDVEFTTFQTRTQLASLYVQLGRYADALSLLIPELHRYARAGSDGFGWVSLTPCPQALAGLGAPELAARLIGALERHGFTASNTRPSGSDLHAAQLSIAQSIDDTEFDRLRRLGHAMTLTEAAIAIDETLAQQHDEYLQTPVQEHSASPLPHSADRP